MAEFLVKAFFLAYRWPASHCSLKWQNEREDASFLVPYKALILAQGLHPYNLITSQRLDLLILSHWGLDFNLWILGVGRSQIAHHIKITRKLDVYSSVGSWILLSFTSSPCRSTHLYYLPGPRGTRIVYVDLLKFLLVSS